MKADQADTPITVTREQLPTCDEGACPLNPDAVTPPPPYQRPVTPVTPTRPAPVVTPTRPAPVVTPTPPSYPVAVPVPLPVQIAPITVSPTPPTAEVQQPIALKLSKYAQDLVPLLDAKDYKEIRRIVYRDFDAGMKKLQTDLARVKARRTTVMKDTSNADTLEDDLKYLDGIVGDAETVLINKYNDRRSQFEKTMNRIVNNNVLQSVSPRESPFLADFIDHLVHDPIADSKKFLNSAVKEINTKTET